VVAASRPYPGEQVNGDGWTVQWHAGRCRVAVIDGLGHGPEAAAATERARAALSRHPELGPVAALARCDAALAGTRGAAISVATIDPVAGRLTYAGIGNIEAQLWQAGTARRPVAYRGIVGVRHRALRAFDFDLDPAWWLLLYTDGISSRLDVTEIAATLSHDPQAAADAALARWGRATDDATVVVACPAHVGTGPAPDRHP
jgi:serine phosphatase RsbU (regulator of sigma subunit)